MKFTSSPLIFTSADYLFPPNFTLYADHHHTHRHTDTSFYQQQRERGWRRSSDILYFFFRLSHSSWWHLANLLFLIFQYPQPFDLELEWDRWFSCAREYMCLLKGQRCRATLLGAIFFFFFYTLWKRGKRKEKEVGLVLEGGVLWGQLFRKCCVFQIFGTEFWGCEERFRKKITDR